MISERNAYTAKRLGDGKNAIGYYVLCRGRHYILPIDIECADSSNFGFDDRYDKWEEIDINTLTSVKVKPEIESEDENGIPYEFMHYHCPNCKNIIHQHHKKSRELMTYSQKYCVDCGMSLDWNQQAN